MSTRPLSLRALLWCAVSLAAASCGRSGPTGPGTGPPAVVPPAIVCPADIVDDVAQAPLALTYTAPVVTGGSAPVSTTCSMASGSTFPSGTSDVMCTATDAQARSAACVFHVDVVVTSTLKGTRVMAFGDSITWGEDGTGEAATGYRIRIMSPQNYPAVLQGLLQARYPSQAASIVIDNEGLQGESAAAGESRLVSAMAANPPDVLLLLEGTNDVNAGTPADEIVQHLRADAARAQKFGVKLLLVGTLPPEVDGRFRAANPDGIEPVNDLIRTLLPQYGATVVDLYAAIAPQAALLIGDDGLHPTAQGYQLIASQFLTAIEAGFEAPPAAAAAQRRSASIAARPLDGAGVSRYRH